MNISEFENQFLEKISQVACPNDPAHDLLHFKRVVATAKKLAASENAKLQVVIPAAWLHDLVNVPKNDPRRKQASRLSAEAAVGFLRQIEYPEIYWSEIAHAIEAHSFSANVETKTIEAQIVQDADRLDALGAIGIARCFATAALMKRPFYSEEDPLCERRPINDAVFTVDHFYAKLFRLVDSLKTQAGRAEGLRRAEFMKTYLKALGEEIQ